MLLERDHVTQVPALDDVQRAPRHLRRQPRLRGQGVGVGKGYCISGVQWNSGGIPLWRPKVTCIASGTVASPRAPTTKAGHVTERSEPPGSPHSAGSFSMAGIDSSPTAWSRTDRCMLRATPASQSAARPGPSAAACAFSVAIICARARGGREGRRGEGRHLRSTARQRGGKGGPLGSLGSAAGTRVGPSALGRDQLDDGAMSSGRCFGPRCFMGAFGGRGDKYPGYYRYVLAQ